jgi:hypothetical protein
MPAQPSTITSAWSSCFDSSISALIRAVAFDAGSSSDRTGTSHARTLAHRLANPYFSKLFSMAAMERESVVTTVKRWPSIEAR